MTIKGHPLGLKELEELTIIPENGCEALYPNKCILNRNKVYCKQLVFVQLPKVIQKLHAFSTNYLVLSIKMGCYFFAQQSTNVIVHFKCITSL